MERKAVLTPATAGTDPEDVMLRESARHERAVTVSLHAWEPLGVGKFAETLGRTREAGLAGGGGAGGALVWDGDSGEGLEVVAGDLWAIP